MSDWHTSYLYAYQYIDNVLAGGTLTPNNAPQGYGPFANVSYRIVDPLDSELEQLGFNEDNPAIVQAFEVWNITVLSDTVSAGSYSPKPQDQWQGIDGTDDVWNVKLATSEPLLARYTATAGASMGTTYSVHPTTRIVCVKQL